jgi:excinuclease ABC subunit A
VTSCQLALAAHRPVLSRRRRLGQWISHTEQSAVLRGRRCGRAAGSRCAGLGEWARADGQHCARGHVGSAEPGGCAWLAGPSGAGKTALVLDSLIPAAAALLTGSAPPGHVRRLDLGDISQVVQIDASPIGQNARSTPATYSGAFDQIRRVFAETAYARRRRWKPGHFSFNTREGQCPGCRGLGHIDLDVQYLPDITVGCPACHGARFNDAILAVQVDGLTMADVLGLSVRDAVERFADRPAVAAALRPVNEVGLGYLRLGEPTPSLSGGESQRLRIASRLRSSQHGTLYVVDEPSTGLHPLDVATLAGVFDRLLAAGATIIVIDHDLDLLAAADHLIDMGPGGGPDGGHIVAAGTPEDVARAPGSVTGPWLAEHLDR